jgi:hypothetical protein
VAELLQFLCAAADATGIAGAANDRLGGRSSSINSGSSSSRKRGGKGGRGRRLQHDFDDDGADHNGDDFNAPLAFRSAGAEYHRATRDFPPMTDEALRHFRQLCQGGAARVVVRPLVRVCLDRLCGMLLRHRAALAAGAEADTRRVLFLVLAVEPRLLPDYRAWVSALLSAWYEDARRAGSLRGEFAASMALAQLDHAAQVARAHYAAGAAGGEAAGGAPGGTTVIGGGAPLQLLPAAETVGTHLREWMHKTPQCRLLRAQLPAGVVGSSGAGSVGGGGGGR